MILGVLTPLQYQINSIIKLWHKIRILVYQMAVNQWQLANAIAGAVSPMPGREVVRGMNPGEGSQSSPDTPQSRYEDIMNVQIL